jgi:WxcM-like, C-terminal
VSTIDDCLIDLPRVERGEGSITPIEANGAIPFAIERVYYVYDVAEGSQRGGHAHRTTQQLLVAVLGSFTVVLDNGRRRRTFELDRPDAGLLVAPMMWRELRNYSSGAVCLALASSRFSEADYVRDYDEFCALAGA